MLTVRTGNLAGGGAMDDAWHKRCTRTARPKSKIVWDCRILEGVLQLLLVALAVHHLPAFRRLCLDSCSN